MIVVVEAGKITLLKDPLITHLHSLESISYYKLKGALQGYERR